jgi:apolipoprotein N-acyltransferase
LAFAGSAHALTFAPDPLPQWSLPIVQILALAVLARASFAAERGRQAFLRGWAFGFVNFAVGLYWLFISIHGAALNQPPRRRT